jgi:hypothetical protein
MSDQSERKDGARGSAVPVPESAATEAVASRATGHPLFRRAATAIASKVRACASASAAPSDYWTEVRQRLAELPHMTAAGEAPATAKPPSRRRRSVPAFPTIFPALSGPRLTQRLPVVSDWFSRLPIRAVIALPDRQDWLLAAALIAFFALGYVAAVVSGTGRGLL